MNMNTWSPYLHKKTPALLHMHRPLQATHGSASATCYGWLPVQWEVGPTAV
eukprot:Gb_05382 [translate_table: standard]